MGYTPPSPPSPKPISGSVLLCEIKKNISNTMWFTLSVQSIRYITEKFLLDSGNYIYRYLTTQR